MAFKDKIYAIMTKIYGIIKRYNPIGYDDIKLIFFGLFINSLSFYTTNSNVANATTLGVVILCLIVFAELERRKK